MNKIILVKSNAPTIWEALGLTEDRKNAVLTKVNNIIKSELVEKPADVIMSVWNSFEEPAETAFALYILQGTENEVLIHELFRLPEPVSATDLVD